MAYADIMARRAERAVEHLDNVVCSGRVAYGRLMDKSLNVDDAFGAMHDGMAHFSLLEATLSDFMAYTAWMMYDGSVRYDDYSYAMGLMQRAMWCIQIGRDKMGDADDMVVFLKEVISHAVRARDAVVSVQNAT